MKDLLPTGHSKAEDESQKARCRLEPPTGGALRHISADATKACNPGPRLWKMKGQLLGPYILALEIGKAEKPWVSSCEWSNLESRKTQHDLTKKSFIQRRGQL